MPGDPGPAWHTARRPVPLDQPVLVGILNVTPDSFSDGGRFTATHAALAHAESLLRDGATIIDVGGESTRPGRTELVSAEEELRRVAPVVEALVRTHPDLLVSIDTVKSAVAKGALDLGAAIVNDVTAFRFDVAMAGVVAAAGAGAILMHSRGGLLEIASYEHADYAGDVVGGVLAELRAALSLAADAGVPADTVVLDPGLGFSKTVEQSVVLFDQLGALQALGRPLLVGPSRKRFLGAVTGLPVEERDRATAAACALAWERGARLFRVHAVAAAREALALAKALDTASQP
ncbi:MAG: dihydropteroate synthase [Gemmatimonadales bacterium]|nr:dihydropteroate synthase [Gemmatimonadales bacterium]